MASEFDTKLTQLKVQHKKVIRAMASKLNSVIGALKIAKQNMLKQQKNLASWFTRSFEMEFEGRKVRLRSIKDMTEQYHELKEGKIQELEGKGNANLRPEEVKAMKEFKIIEGIYREIEEIKKDQLGLAGSEEGILSQRIKTVDYEIKELSSFASSLAGMAKGSLTQVAYNHIKEKIDIARTTITKIEDEEAEYVVIDRNMRELASKALELENRVASLIAQLAKISQEEVKQEKQDEKKEEEIAKSSVGRIVNK